MKNLRKILFIWIILSFLLQTVVPSRNVWAQSVPMPNISPIPIQSPAYRSAIIKGLTLYPDNPLQFDFIVERGDDDLQGQVLRRESLKMIKYFLASLTTPQKEMWVNLSPNEPDRIIPESFGQTEMGRDLLAQDYLLKQLTASMMYPEEELGKKFWARIYERAAKEYGTTQIPMNTFNKVWIVPEKAVVMEHQNSAFVVERKLKVMLEEDYLSLQKKASAAKDGHALASQVVREIIIPELEREVNEGKTFANLRQIYNSMILATWYKQTLRESLLGQVYVDQKKVKGVDVDDPAAKQNIYEQYLEAFKKGVYNFIREEVDPATQKIIPRKYFSGGLAAPKQVTRTTPDQATPDQRAEPARGDHDVVTIKAGELGPQAAAGARQAAEAVSLRGPNRGRDEAMLIGNDDEQPLQKREVPPYGSGPTGGGPAFRRGGDGLSRDFLEKVKRRAVDEYFGNGPRRALREDIPIGSPLYQRLNPNGVFTQTPFTVQSDLVLEDGQPRTREGILIFHLPGIKKRMREIADEHFRETGEWIEVPEDLVTTIGRKYGQIYLDTDDLQEIASKPRDYREVWSEHENAHIRNPDATESQIQEEMDFPIPRDTFFYDALRSGQYAGAVNWNFLDDVVEGISMQVIEYLLADRILQQKGSQLMIPLQDDQDRPSVLLREGAHLRLAGKPITLDDRSTRVITPYEEMAIEHRLQQIVVLNFLGSRLSSISGLHGVSFDVRSIDGLMEALKLIEREPSSPYMVSVELALRYVGQEAVQPLARFLRQHPQDIRREKTVNILINIHEAGGDLNEAYDDLLAFAWLALERTSTHQDKRILGRILNLLNLIPLRPEDANFFNDLINADEAFIPIVNEFFLNMSFARRAEFARQARTERLRRIEKILADIERRERTLGGSSRSEWFRTLELSGFFEDIRRIFPPEVDFEAQLAEWDRAIQAVVALVKNPRPISETTIRAALGLLLATATVELYSRVPSPTIPRWIELIAIMSNRPDGSGMVSWEELSDYFAGNMREVFQDALALREIAGLFARGLSAQDVMASIREMDPGFDAAAEQIEAIFREARDRDDSPESSRRLAPGTEEMLAMAREHDPHVHGRAGARIHVYPLRQTTDLPARLADRLEQRFGLRTESEGLPEGLADIQDHVRELIRISTSHELRLSFLLTIEAALRQSPHPQMIVEEVNKGVLAPMGVSPFDPQRSGLIYDGGEYRWLGIAIARRSGEEGREIEFLLNDPRVADRFFSALAEHLRQRFGIDQRLALPGLAIGLTAAQEAARRLVRHLRTEEGARDFIAHLNLNLQGVGRDRQSQIFPGFLWSVVYGVTRSFFAPYGIRAFDEPGVDFRYEDGDYQFLDETVAVEEDSRNDEGFEPDPGPAMRRSGQGLSQAQHTVINAAIAEYFGRGHEHFQGERAQDREHMREEIPLGGPDYRRLDPDGVQATAHIRIPDGVELEPGMARERIGVVKLHLPGVLRRAQELADEYYRQTGIPVEIPQDLLATVGRRRGQEYWDTRGLLEMMVRPRAERVAAAAHEWEHIQDALEALHEDREPADEQTIQARAPSPPRDTVFHDALRSGQYDAGRVNFDFLKDVVEDFWMQVLKYLEEGGILQRVGETMTYQIIPLTPEGTPSVVLTRGIGDLYRSSLGLRHNPVDTPTGRRGITRYEEDAILHRLQQIAVLNILGDHVAPAMQSQGIDADVRSVEGLIEALRLPQYVQPVELALFHLGQDAVRPLAQFLQEHPGDSRRSRIVRILIRLAQEGGDLTGIRNELVVFTTSLLAEEEPTPGAHKDLLEDILRWLLPHLNLEPQDAQFLESFDGRVDREDLEVFFRFRLPLARRAQFAEQARAEARPRLSTILSEHSVWFQRLSESGFFRDFERESPLPEDWDRARFEADWEQAIGGMAREIGEPENDDDEAEGVAIFKELLADVIPRLRAHGIEPQFIAKWIWLTMFRVDDSGPTVAGAELPEKFAEALTGVLGDPTIQAKFRALIESNARYEDVLMQMFEDQPGEGDFLRSPSSILGEPGSSILIRPLSPTSPLPGQLADHLERRFGLVGDDQRGLKAIQSDAERFVDSLKDSDGRQRLASIIEEFFMDPIIRDHLGHQRFTEVVDEFNRQIRDSFLLTVGFPFDANVGALTYEQGEYRWFGMVVARQEASRTNFLLLGALLDQFCTRVARHVSSQFGVGRPISLSELPPALMEVQRNVRQVVDQLRQDAGAADFINRVNTSLETTIASVGHVDNFPGFLLVLVDDIIRQYFVNYGFRGFDEPGVDFRYRDGAYQLLNETVAVTMRKGVASDGSRGDQAMLLENETPPVGGIDFNADMLDLQIKRDENGVPLPLPQQPLETMHIEGFLPIIIDVKPIDLPAFLGLKDSQPATSLVEAG